MAKRTKVVDKWKTKKWFRVEAPSTFDNSEVCEIVATDEKQLMNRIITVNLSSLTSSRSQMAAFTRVQIRDCEVGPTTAKTKLIGHSVSSAYMKTFARRGKTLGHYVVDVKTKDGEVLRVKAIAVTTGRISATTKKNLGKKIIEEILNLLKDLTFEEAMKEILYEKFSPKIFGKLKQITSMRRFEIRKTERKETFN